MQACTIGIDVGTSVAKAVAFADDGAIVALARRTHGFDQPQPGWAECLWTERWSTVAETVRSLVARLPDRGAAVRGIGVSGHMAGVGLIDEAGEPVRPAILWNDGRAAGLLEEMRRTGALDEVFAISGNAPTPGMAAPLLRWLHDREPAVMARARWLLCTKDWINLQLTGRIATDPTDGYRLPGAIAPPGYSRHVLELFGAVEAERLLPPVRESGEIVGTVTTTAAARTGLRAGTPVVAGLGDVPASLIGAGAIAPGTTSVVLGTSCLVSVARKEPSFAPPGVGLAFLLPGGGCTRTLPNQTGLIAQDWFVRTFLQPTGEIDYPALDRRTEAVPPGARGIVFHPYLNPTGVIAPVYAPHARARFWGLALHHTADDLLRAVREGVGYAILDCLEHLDTGSGPIRAIGGATRSDFWPQLMADMAGRPVEIAGGTEHGALGVALLAGAATGVWPDLATAVRRCAQVAGIVAPRAEPHDVYRRQMRVYRHLRSRLPLETEFVPQP